MGEGNKVVMVGRMHLLEGVRGREVDSVDSQYRQSTNMEKKVSQDHRKNEGANVQ